MPQTPHIERHFTASETVRDVIIGMSVRDQLMRDTRLAGQSITITASGGFIQVVGTVDTEEHKQLALDMARGMAGVRHVEDQIEVRGTAAR